MRGSTTRNTRVILRWEFDLEKELDLSEKVTLTEKMSLGRSYSNNVIDLTR